MSTIINGTSSAITFPDSSVQNTSAIVSGYVPYANLPAGSVLQVVNASLSTVVSSSAATPSDTGLSATITPKFATSKILVLVSHNGINRSGGGYLGSFLVRNSTQLTRFDGSAGFNGGGSSTQYLTGSSTSYLDSPATTSATTYKTQIQNGNGGNTAGINVDGAISTLTLMEIAA